MSTPDWITFDIDIEPNFTCSFNECEINYPCADPFACSPYIITLSKGIYLVDVFGAEGGGIISPGKGGEIKGLLTLNRNTILYAYIGAKGASGSGYVNVKGTFGGGGSGYGYYNFHFIGSGGGASDIRLVNDSLTSRVIVAGGGGGGGKNNQTGQWNESPGGDGSGYNGKSATSTTTKGTPGSGAFINKPGEKGVKGLFDYGGNAVQAAGMDGSGGGGGYYGGNAGKSYCSGGGGGSGYYNKRFFIHHESFTGVREGNGMIKIAKLFSNHFIHKTCLRKRNSSYMFSLLALIVS